MREAATAFIDALRPRQRATAVGPFESPDHREWTYVPGPRPGLALADMMPGQRVLAMNLLDTGLSVSGRGTARAIMSLETTLRDIEKAAGVPGWDRRDSDFFWFRVLGEPHHRHPWAWRTNGHHIAVHATIVGDAVSVTPQFFGANPAMVPHTGIRTLPQEEDLARDLLASLDDGQRDRAITSPFAPDDILSRMDPAADPARIPVGVAYSELRSAQRDALAALIRCYLGRVTPDAADFAWHEVLSAGLDGVRFSWAGSDRRGERHYYSVLGPTFLLEYDNTQTNANHVHTVWRDLRHDWGDDLLAAHYRSHRH
jgi:hypothetical protein